jgi:hypothetical protein
VVAHILCECDHSRRISDGRLERVGPFGPTQALIHSCSA